MACRRMVVIAPHLHLSCRQATFCCAGCGDIRGPGSQRGVAAGQVAGDIPAESSMRIAPGW
eukprot:410570-Prorocentrum_lima.AAC.1